MWRLQRDRPACVRTRSGRVTADAVVLAMNAWTAAVPELRRSLLPVSSDVVATRPVPEVLEQIHWTAGEAIADGRLRVNYYQATQDDRIVFGKGGGTLAFGGRIDAGFHHDEARAALVAAQFRRITPAAAGAAITHSWAGPVARTAEASGPCTALANVSRSWPWLAMVWESGAVTARTGFRGIIESSVGSILPLLRVCLRGQRKAVSNVPTVLPDLGEGLGRPSERAHALQDSTVAGEQRAPEECQQRLYRQVVDAW